MPSPVPSIWSVLNLCLLDGREGGQMDGWTDDEQVGGLKSGRVGRWMDRWMIDEQMVEQALYREV